MNTTRLALLQIDDALRRLRNAKDSLRMARNDQHLPLAMQIAAIEEVRDILADPECTPEVTDDD